MTKFGSLRSTTITNCVIFNLLLLFSVCLFTPFVCIATIINLKFYALDVMTPSFHHFIPKFNVKNHFTINNNLRMKEGACG